MHDAGVIKMAVETEKLPIVTCTHCTHVVSLLVPNYTLLSGIKEPTATQAEKNFWALDLAQPAAQRHGAVLESRPGTGRMLAVAGTQEGAFYLLVVLPLQSSPAIAPCIVPF